ncbi:nitrate- and nitrite sensing domain-containing protein [Sulfurimonas sp. SAG-AH-194-C21]|nr:nitrate- and nitrite sensing domain-containing protein [Sulfurimonas sp. SAG-AH-194-C21]MDF1884017.1 nitrate- and nitrite sensing domain-containing protein [Sulfurimonas sp. SAG-AH-194-C21]
MNIVPLKKKIPKFLFVPLAIVLIFALYSGYYKYQESKTYEKIHKYMHFTIPAEELIHELQKERGYSSAYLSSSSKVFYEKLQKQRILTDEKIINFKTFVTTHKCDSTFKKDTLTFLNSLKRLALYRKNIDDLVPKMSIDFYTNSINKLIKSIRHIISISQSNTLFNLIESYVSIIEMKEKAGLERALISNILGKSTMSHQEFYQLGRLIAAQEAYYGFFTTVSLKKHSQLFKTEEIQKYFTKVKNKRIQLYEKSKRNEILAFIKENIGYGGLIHNFKNYVIRGNTKYAKAVQEDYNNLAVAINKYKNLEGTTQEEIKELEIIKKVFSEYLNKIKIVTKAYKLKKVNIHELDYLVKVNDRPALDALENLTKNIYGSSSEWFEIATKRIDTLRDIELIIVDDISIFIDKHINNITLAIIGNIIIVLIILIIIISSILVFRELIESGKMLNRAQENTRSGSYEYYFHESLLFWSDEYYKLLEVDKNIYTPTLAKFLSFVDKSDRESFKESMQKAIRTKEIVFIEYKVILRSKKILFVRSSFEVVKYDISGKPKSMVGTMTDISDAKYLEQEIIDTQKDIIMTMGAIGESRSKETANHVNRVAEYSYLLAKLCGEDKHQAELVKMASPMHDIGKVGIADGILHKAGKLTSSEWKIMQTHSELGYEILKGSDREILKLAATIAYTHHEYYDGSGYPRGLKGANIPKAGRIVAIVDVFDALGSDRCYKKAWEIDKVIEYIRQEKDKMFDPYLVDIFLDNIDDFLAIKAMYQDEIKT